MIKNLLAITTISLAVTTALFYKQAQQAQQESTEAKHLLAIQNAALAIHEKKLASTKTQLANYKKQLDKQFATQPQPTSQSTCEEQQQQILNSLHIFKSNLQKLNQSQQPQEKPG